MGLSATVDDPGAIARLLARHPDPCPVLQADPGPDPDMTAQAALHMAALYAHDRVRALSGGAPPEATGLSAREIEALKAAARGRTDAEIGEALGISARTVRFHLGNARAKLGLNRGG